MNDLTEQEKATKKIYDIRQLIWFLNALVGCFGGLIVLILTSHNGINPDWMGMGIGLIMILIAVVSVFTSGPWTEKEKALKAKLDPEEN